MTKVEEHMDLFAQYEFEEEKYTAGYTEIVLVDLKMCRRVKFRIISYIDPYYFVQLPPVGTRNNWITIGTFTTQQNAEEFIWLKLSEEKKNGSTNEEEHLSCGCN